MNEFFRKQSFRTNLDAAVAELQNKNGGLPPNKQNTYNMLVLNHHFCCVYKTSSDHPIMQDRLAVTNSQSGTAHRLINRQDRNMAFLIVGLSNSARTDVDADDYRTLYGTTLFDTALQATKRSFCGDEFLGTLLIELNSAAPSTVQQTNATKQQYHLNNNLKALGVTKEKLRKLLVQNMCMSAYTANINYLKDNLTPMEILSFKKDFNDKVTCSITISSQFTTPQSTIPPTLFSDFLSDMEKIRVDHGLHTCTKRNKFRKALTGLD